MTEQEMNKLLASNEQMEGIFKMLEEDEEADKVGITTIFSALSLPEKEFAFVSEQLLNECEKAINNVGDKLFLVQSLNASGMKAEDFMDVFDKLQVQIDTEFAGKLSQQKIDYLKRFLAIIANAINNTEGIAKRIIPVAIELCHTDAKIPAYAKAGDAGMDVYAVEDMTINPGETVIVPTGLKCALPLGYEFEVRPRSGLSVKTPLRVANAPGTIDSGYRDEIGVIITNIEPKIKDIDFAEDGTPAILYGQSYTISKGMRFAQLVLKEVPACAFYEVSKVAEIGFNRDGGFGSSGTK